MEFLFLKDLRRNSAQFKNFVAQLSEFNTKDWSKKDILRELEGSYDCLVAAEGGIIRGFVSFNRDRAGNNTLKTFGWYDLARYYYDKLEQAKGEGNLEAIRELERKLEAVGGAPKITRNPLSLQLAGKMFEIASKGGFKAVQMGRTDVSTKRMLETVNRRRERFNIPAELKIIPEERRVEFPDFRSAAIVLGCWVSPFKTLPEEAKRRVNGAIRLVKENKVDKIILTGGVANPKLPWMSYKEADAMRKYAIKMGIPPNRIITEIEARTTEGNARKTLPIVKSFGVESVNVVTTKVHADWASKNFDRIFRKGGYRGVLTYRIQPSTFPATIYNKYRKKKALKGQRKKVK